jgi:hypothetical protein
MSATPILYMFNAGELSPTLDGRTDHEKYFAGCRRLENFLVHPHGPAYRRSGFRFIREVKDSSKPVRLIPFDYNGEEDQSYIIEVGDEYMRFYKDGGIILDGNGDPYEISSPWTADQLWRLQYVQDENTLYVVHPEVSPRTLTRSGHASWSLAAMSFTAQPGEWGANNWPSVVGIYEERLVLGATPSYPLTLWLSCTGEFTNFTTNSTTGTEAEGDPLDTDAIELTLSGSRVNPIRWILDQSELVAGTNASEVKIWSGSSSAPMTPLECQTKRQSAYGSAPVQAKLISSVLLFVSRSRRKVREFVFDYLSDRYVAPELTLLAEHVTRAGIQDMDYAREPHGVLWCALQDGSLAGCTYLREQKVCGWHRHPLGGNGAAEAVAVIPGVDGDELWAVIRRSINGETKRYVERLDPSFDGEGQETAENGFFVDSGLNYDGWNTNGAALLQIEGASYAKGDAVTLFAEGHEPFGEDSIGACYRLRSGAGAEADRTDVRVTAYSSATEASAVLLTKAPASLQGAAVSDWAKLIQELQLPHLEGESVHILADGSVKNAQTVEGGVVTLSKPAAKVAAGYGFTSILQPMRIEVQSARGTSQTKRKRVLAVSIRFLATVGGEVCPGDDAADKYESILSHATPSKGGVAPRLFSTSGTTDKQVQLASGYDRDGLLTIRQADPLPMTVVCIVPEVLSES